MPEYIIFTKELRGQNHVMRGEMKEARAIAQYEANMSRTPIHYGIVNKSAHIAYPERPTLAEFIGAVRRAVAGLHDSSGLVYEMWVKHMYTGERNVYGAIGYIAHNM